MIHFSRCAIMRRWLYCEDFKLILSTSFRFVQVLQEILHWFKHRRFVVHKFLYKFLPWLTGWLNRVNTHHFNLIIYSYGYLKSYLVRENNFRSGLREGWELTAPPPHSTRPLVSGRSNWANVIFPVLLWRTAGIVVLRQFSSDVSSLNGLNGIGLYYE
jgi:hypothetical protein